MAERGRWTIIDTVAKQRSPIVETDSIAAWDMLKEGTLPPELLTVPRGRTNLVDKLLCGSPKIAYLKRKLPFELLELIVEYLDSLADVISFCVAGDSLCCVGQRWFWKMNTSRTWAGHPLWIIKDFCLDESLPEGLKKVYTEQTGKALVNDTRGVFFEFALEDYRERSFSSGSIALWNDEHDQICKWKNHKRDWAVYEQLCVIVDAAYRLSDPALFNFKTEKFVSLRAICQADWTDLPASAPWPNLGSIIMANIFAPSFDSLGGWAGHRFEIAELNDGRPNGEWEDLSADEVESFSDMYYDTYAEGLEDEDADTELCDETEKGFFFKLTSAPKFMKKLSLRHF